MADEYLDAGDLYKHECCIKLMGLLLLLLPW